jgi:DNA-binding transcriptional LysR family regulator
MKSLSSIHIFVEVAKAKSFRGASDALQMPSSTVSRRIAELEAEVGLRLFNRTTRRVDLTDAGSVYFGKCKKIIDDAQLAFDELTEMKTNPSGLLRLSMPVAFISEWLAPLLPEFAQLFPEIQLDINVSKVPVPLFSDAADVAIVFGYPTGQDVVPRKIVEGRTGLYASSGYLDEYGTPEKPQDLAKHVCLAMHRGSSWELTNTTIEKKESVAVGGQVTINIAMVLRDLAIQGMGIAGWVQELAKNDVRQNRLVRVLPDWNMDSGDWYAVTTSRNIPLKARVFINFLVEKLMSNH